MILKITKEGKLPDPITFKGKCTLCQCEVEGQLNPLSPNFTTTPAPERCPTKNCGGEIEMRMKPLKEYL